MALVPRLSNASATKAANAVLEPDLDNGYLRIYDGTQPATADTAITSQNLLATLRWNATAFAGAVNGVATANAIASDPSAALTGTATWFRALKSDGTTVVFDGSVGTSGANLNLNSALISAGALVAVTSFSYTQSEN